MVRKLRAGVIGAGWYAAQNHIPVLAARDDVELDGVCRLGEAELERVKTHFGFSFASENPADVLARKPDIVVVATPHQVHYRWTREALLGGAHVLCEKPLTLDPAEAWELVRIAREQHCQLIIANGYQYLPRVNDLRQRIAEGLIGEIEHVMASFISATRDVFLGEKGLNSWKTTFFRPERSTWQNPSQGGGFAYGQLSHSLALMMFLTGRRPVRASAASFAREEVDLTDSGALLLDNGATASISGAAALPQGNRGLMRLFIAGSGGVITAEFDRDFCEIKTHDAPNEQLDIPEGGWIYNCRGPVNALADLALGRGSNLSPGEIGAATTATIAAMLQSSRDGGTPVSVAAEQDAL
jgi:predicted dehydrogenase